MNYHFISPLLCLFIFPANIRAINIHTTGAGSGGKWAQSDYYSVGGTGGGGGYTSYKTGIAVSPGQKIDYVVGAGGLPGHFSLSESVGNTSSCSIASSILVSALGGNRDKNGKEGFGVGGSSGGKFAYFESWRTQIPPTPGASDGGNAYALGQGSTTREFGLSTGILCSGGGGGGGAVGASNNSDNTRYTGLNGAPGGAGGGGAGGGINAQRDETLPKLALVISDGISGSAGTGGAGGGASANERIESLAGAGGSGNVIITW